MKDPSHFRLGLSYVAYDGGPKQVSTFANATEGGGQVGIAGCYPLLSDPIGGEPKVGGESVPGESPRMSTIAESTTAGGTLSVETTSTTQAAAERSVLFSEP